MLGFSIPELILCFIVALIVIGPERMPEAVRTVGLWIGRFKRMINETKENIERQVGMDDIRRQLHTEEMMKTLEDMQDEIDSALYYERMGIAPPSNQSLLSADNSSTIDVEASHLTDNSVISNENYINAEADQLAVDHIARENPSSQATHLLH